MTPWSPDVEEELASVLKDWLKQQGEPKPIFAEASEQLQHACPL
jgi:hypothetical protein